MLRCSSSFLSEAISLMVLKGIPSSAEVRMRIFFSATQSPPLIRSRPLNTSPYAPWPGKERYWWGHDLWTSRRMHHDLKERKRLGHDLWTPHRTHHDLERRMRRETLSGGLGSPTVKPRYTGCQGTNKFICYWRIYVIANIGSKKKWFEGTRVWHSLLADFCYSWIRYSGV